MLEVLVKRFKTLEWFDKIRALRVFLGKTRAELAKEIGTTEPVIRSWELNVRKPCGGNKHSLAMALGVKDSDIFPKEAKKGKKINE